MNAPKVGSIPYVVFGATLPLVVFSISALIFSGVLIHTDIWWIMIAAPFGAAFLGYLSSLDKLHKNGLPRSTTMAEFDAAVDQKVSGKNE